MTSSHINFCQWQRKSDVPTRFSMHNRSSLARFSNFTILSRGRALNTLHTNKSKREAAHLMMDGKYIEERCAKSFSLTQHSLSLSSFNHLPLSRFKKVPDEIHGHGRMMDPPSRNAMWRFGYPNPVNYNDNELFCGGYAGAFAKTRRESP